MLSLRALPGLELLPVWSLLNSGGLERFPRLRQVQQLVIAVDHDDAGRKAANACLQHWERAVFVQADTPGQDLNDAINTQHEEPF